MKTEKLAENEVLSIKEIQKIRAEIIEKYGLIEMAIQDLELQKQEVTEEFKELKEAIAAGDLVEQLDALEDILVVTIGAIHSAGMDGEGGWKEVMRTNFAKIDKETGKVRKREDGKVLKPLGWTPPDLKPFITKE